MGIKRKWARIDATATVTSDFLLVTQKTEDTSEKSNWQWPNKTEILSLSQWREWKTWRMWHTQSAETTSNKLCALRSFQCQWLQKRSGLMNKGNGMSCKMWQMESGIRLIMKKDNLLIKVKAVCMWLIFSFLWLIKYLDCILFYIKYLS